MILLFRGVLVDDRVLNRKVPNVKLFGVVGQHEKGEEMYQNVKRMCGACNATGFFFRQTFRFWCFCSQCRHPCLSSLTIAKRSLQLQNTLPFQSCTPGEAEYVDT